MTILLCRICAKHKKYNETECCGNPASEFLEIELDFGKELTRTNITLPKGLVAEARYLELNISEIAKKALRHAIKMARN